MATTDPTPLAGSRGLRAWLARRLANRLAAAAGLLAMVVLVIGVLVSLVASLRSERRHVNTELALRADSTSRRVAAVLEDIERGVHGVAASSFVLRTLAAPDKADDTLLPFLVEHRVVTRYGVVLRLCDRAAQPIVRVGPDAAGHGHVDGTGPPCNDILDFQGRLHDRRPAVLTTGSSDAHPHLQLQVPVRSGQGAVGAVVADIDPERALQQILAEGDAPLALFGAQGELGGRGPRPGFVVVDAPIDLPSGSDFEPLRLGVRVGIDDSVGSFRWGALAASYLAGMLLLSGLVFIGVRQMIRRMLAPLSELERVADLAASGTPVELPEILRRPDEVGRLAGRIKGLADTLQRNNALLAAQVAEMATARNTAQQASVAKTEFLATMSHEIRTPMNAILGLSYLALQAPLDGKARDYIAKTHDAAESLLGILNGILDFSKVEAGQMHLEREPFVLRQMIDRVITTAGVKAQAKGLELRVEVEDRVPREVVGDALRLGQVLLNLCDNAIKFTEHGHIEVSVQVMLMLGKEVELLFSVGDTGAGIPTIKQRTIFELFTQADASTTRRHGGTGLGLAISKKLVELMGGHLGVSSQVGSGSTFSFTARFGAVAPRAEDADAVSPVDAGTPAQRYAALRGTTVLLAEDNELNQLLARELLEQVGVEVLVAPNGRAAIELLREHPEVDLVLMDCQMPVMDGFAATRAIRSDKKLPRVPILAMTANVLPEDLASCRGAGMNDHIGKPIDVEELYSVMQQWLHRLPEGGGASQPASLDTAR